MDWFRPRSIAQLVIIGFALVVAPLIFALTNVGLSVDRLSEQSERAVLQAVKATQGSQLLMELITAMERNARQYEVLGENSLFQAYDENHQNFIYTIADLSGLELAASQKALLEQLSLHEAQAYRYVSAIKQHESATDIEEMFQKLAQIASSILVQNRELIDEEVAATQTAASEMQSSLYWQVTALAPLVLVLMVLFIVLIVRPIRKMDDSIRQLGDGDLSRPISLKGPKDFENLGQRLDWLRLRLADVEGQKRKFLRHISHELKTPLTNIREGSELLSDEVVGHLNSQQKEIIEILRDNGVQLQRLIEDLLNYNSATREMEQLNRHCVRLDELMEQVINEHKMEIFSKQIRVEKQIQSISVDVDKDKIRVVVDNLLSNALKYSPTEGSLKIELKQRGDYAEIAVEDQGPGIPEQERERVFDAFYQGDGHYSSHVKGSGLGLAIVREYVNAHDGRILIEGVRNQGTRFVVQLPQRHIQDAA